MQRLYSWSAYGAVIAFFCLAFVSKAYSQSCTAVYLQSKKAIAVVAFPTSEKALFSQWGKQYGHIAEFKSIKKNLSEALSKVEDPLSIVSGLVRGADKKIRTLQELDKFVEALLDSQNAITKLSDWVKSEDHALFIYDFLTKTTLSYRQQLLDHLIAQNLYFTDSYPVRGPPAEQRHLVTYSFEKEGFSEKITDWYRSPKKTDAEWALLTESQRLDELQQLHLPVKKFLDPSAVAFTKDKPDYLSGFSLEAGDSQRSGWSWEISHKAYEISYYQTIKRIREVSRHFNETHSIHAHVVFEIPRKYKSIESFMMWFKRLNDYLYLRGIEEGLHGNYLTGIANLKTDLSLWERVSRQIHIFSTNDSIGLHSDNSLGQSSKFFSAGLRSGIYGAGISKDSKRIGIELRDTTRNLDKLEDYIKQVSESVSEFRWEVAADRIGQIQDRTPRLTTGHLPIWSALVEAVGVPMATRMFRAEKTMGTALLRYEEGQYFDYALGKFRSPTAEQAHRIIQAREHFIRELQLLKNELEALASKGEKTEDALVAGAIKMILTDWARRAQISELYSGI